MAAQELPKKPVPDRVHRELRKGETIYHSTLPCHVSAKYPDGKWIAQVRREERGKLAKFPVRGFGSPKEALDYIKSLRPDGAAHNAVLEKGEPTVEALYEYVRVHRQKRLSPRTKSEKEARWKRYIGPEWADWPLSRVSRRAAQEWVTRVEGQILGHDSGGLGLAQFEKVRTDLHAMFECLSIFSPEYEDRRNPFSDLDFLAQPPRAKITIQSQHFAAIMHACERMSAEGLCTPWVAEMFMVSLLSGLRLGEVMALCKDQVDLKAGTIRVDRALRRTSRALNPATRLEEGPVLRQAVSWPKGGTHSNPKIRLIPISDQLAHILWRATARPRSAHGIWNLLWPGSTGETKELARFRAAWVTLRERLSELSVLTPIEFEGGDWPEFPKRQGWSRNPLVQEARDNPHLRLPRIFDRIDFRDTRNSFASYMNEVGISQATREQILGHTGGLTNAVYTAVTEAAFQNARTRLTNGWRTIGPL